MRWTPLTAAREHYRRAGDLGRQACVRYRFRKHRDIQRPVAESGRETSPWATIFGDYDVTITAVNGYVEDDGDGGSAMTAYTKVQATHDLTITAGLRFRLHRNLLSHRSQGPIP